MWKLIIPLSTLLLVIFVSEKKKNKFKDKPLT